MSALSKATGTRRRLIDTIVATIENSEATLVPPSDDIGIMADEIADFLIDNQWVTEEPS